MLQIPTLQELYARARTDAKTMMQSEAQIPTLSMLNVLIVVFVGLLRGLYGHLYNLSVWLLPDRAQGRFLERYLSVYGIVPSSGSGATGTVKFAGSVGTVVPANTLVRTVDGTQYYTVAQTAIASDGFSPNTVIQSSSIGVGTNYIGTQMLLVNSISGISGTVSLTSDIVGGTGPDTEESLREKLILAIRNPNTLGLAEDYQRIALGVTGVGRVWVTGGNSYTGPNTVEITLATLENAPVSNTALTTAQSLFNSDAYRQPGIITYVKNLEVIPVDMTITLIPNNIDTRTRCNTTLAALFTDGVAPSEELKVSDVRSAISTAAPDDYVLVSMTADGTTYSPPANILPTAGKKFSLGTVTYA